MRVSARTEVRQAAAAAQQQQAELPPRKAPRAEINHHPCVTCKRCVCSVGGWILCLRINDRQANVHGKGQ